jgi:hypothetical protein
MPSDIPPDVPPDIPQSTGTRIGGMAADVVARLRPLALSGHTAADPRVATSVTLCGAFLCVVLAASPPAAPPSKAAAARSANAPVTLTAIGSGPAFCKQQTWPEIDPRCVKRTEPAEPISVPAVTTNVGPSATETGLVAAGTAAPQPLLKSSSEPAPAAGFLPAGIGSAGSNRPVSPQAAPLPDLPPPPGSVRLSDAATRANDKASELPPSASLRPDSFPPRSARIVSGRAMAVGSTAIPDRSKPRT